MHFSAWFERHSFFGCSRNDHALKCVVFFKFLDITKIELPNISVPSEMRHTKFGAVVGVVDGQLAKNFMWDEATKNKSFKY